MSELFTHSTAEEDWDHIQALFKARKIRSSPSWNFGVSSRMHRKRLKKLMQSDAAGQLALFLDERSDVRLKALRTFAAINMEQASVAFRVTIIANVTAPVLFLTVLNILAPGSLSETIASAFTASQVPVIVFTLLFTASLIWLVAILSFSVASLGQARDIRHLIDLIAAERGIYFGLEDMDDLQSP